MDVKRTMILTLFIISSLIYCQSLTVVVDNSRRALSSPDPETMDTPTDETGQKQVPDLTLVRDGAGRVDSHTVSSAWFDDVRLTFKRRADLWKGNIIIDQSKKYVELVQDPVL